MHLQKEKVDQLEKPCEESKRVKLWETIQNVFLQIWNFLEPLIMAIAAILGVIVTAVIGIANGS